MLKHYVKHIESNDSGSDKSKKSNYPTPNAPNANSRRYNFFLSPKEITVKTPSLQRTATTKSGDSFGELKARMQDADISPTWDLPHAVMYFPNFSSVNLCFAEIKVPA